MKKSTLSHTGSSPATSYVLLAILFSLVLLTLVLFQSLTSQTPGSLTSEVKGTATADPSLPSITPIPTSQPAAKLYIERAVTAAGSGEYRQAVTILEEAIKAFPDDQNLQLTQEYYENEAQRRGQ